MQLKKDIQEQAVILKQQQEQLLEVTLERDSLKDELRRLNAGKPITILQDAASSEECTGGSIESGGITTRSKKALAAKEAGIVGGCKAAAGAAPAATRVKRTALGNVNISRNTAAKDISSGSMKKEIFDLSSATADEVVIDLSDL
jgi:hypothetical protein